MASWFEIGEGWTHAIKERCAELCAPDRPCYTLGGQGQVGGPVELITPCAECLEDTHDPSSQRSKTNGDY